MSFLKGPMRMDDQVVNLVLLVSGLVAMSFYVFVGRWSDRVGRKKPIIIGALASLALLFPIFWGLGALANPGLRQAAAEAPVAVLGTSCEFDAFAQKQATDCGRLLQDLTALGVPFLIENQDTYSIVKRVIPEGKTMCSLCSRLRRGVLYRVAQELGATKIALGHHRDDILETFMLNMFYGGKLKSMPPKLVSDDGRNVVIRPLAYCEESDLEAYAALRRLPIIPCTLCGSQENLKRKEMKAMLREWEKRHPGRVETILTSLQNVRPSHLMDRTLFDFAAVRATGAPVADGDTAFDSE